MSKEMDFAQLVAQEDEIKILMAKCDELRGRIEQLEAENMWLREALEARRDWFAMQLKDTGNGNLSEWDRHTLQIELDAANAALNAMKGS